MKKLVEIKHYKDLTLPSSPEPNSVYYILDQFTNKVKTFITDKSGFPIPLVDLTGGVGGVVSITGTGVTGTSVNPKVDIATFISQQIGNRVYLSLQDGKLNVNPITSPNNTISVTSTPTELQLKISDTIITQINSALQPGDNISSLTNNVGYIRLQDIPAFDPSNYDLSQFDNLSSDPFVRSSQLSDGETNLGYVASSTNGIITSNTGTDAIIPLATNTNAGLLSPSEKQTIAGAAQSTNLATVATTGSYTDLLNIPSSFTPSAHTHTISEVVNLQSTLDGKEVIANKQNNLSTDGTGTKYPTVDAVSSALTNKADLVGGIVPSAQIGSTTNVVEGNNLYFTTSRVLSTLLTGLIDVAGALDPTDNVLLAFGKIKKTLSDLTNSISGKEDTVNKSQNINTDQSSTIKYPSVKAVFDWAVGRFQNILVSGVNIKTINGTNILGSGNALVGTGRVVIYDSEMITHTGTTAANLVLRTWTIPPNTIPPNCVARMQLRIRRPVNANASGFAALFVSNGTAVNNADDYIRNVNTVGNNTTSTIVRHLLFKNGTLSRFSNSGSTYTDFGLLGGYAETPFNTTVENKINISFTLGTATDIVFMDYMLLEILSI